jgi:hypothetical protein
MVNSDFESKENNFQQAGHVQQGYCSRGAKPKQP